MSVATGSYPVNIEVAPAAAQSRLTVLFRYFMLLPHGIALGILGFVWQLVALISWFAILFTGKLPEGMAKFSADALHWNTRFLAYAYLLTGQFPPFAMGDVPAYPVRTHFTPQIEGRNRITVLFRLFMLIPHLIVLYVFSIVAGVVLFISWFAALFTGRVPDGMHNFLAGVARYTTRVYAYGLLLTDEFPPIGLN